MSERFVSSGTIGPSGDVEKRSSDVPETSITDKASNPAWETVQKELDAERKRREEQRLKAATGEEKSLYDILQENKGLFWHLRYPCSEGDVDAYNPFSGETGCL